MSRFSTLLVVGVVFTQLGLGSQTVKAADEVKVKVYNGSSFVINRLKLYIDTTLVDTSRKYLRAGQSNQVNWVAGNKKNGGDLSLDYAIVAGPQSEKCSKKIQITAGSPAGQLKKIQLPDGRVYNLDSNVDEVITVRYKVTGAKDRSMCDLGRVRKRLR